MKNRTYPFFLATGMVDVFAPGDIRPTITVKASCYISFHDESHSLMVREAKYRLEQAGVPKEKVDTFYFEGTGITELHAQEPKGVRRVYGEPVEAFIDSVELKKRDVLIRQRRIVPYSHSDMLEIYGPKEAAA